MWSTATSSSAAGSSTSGPYAPMKSQQSSGQDSSSMSGPMSMMMGPPQGGMEMCRFFLNGGCIRGDACPYLHEFPDERHLDVNGVGFIFNTGVQNSNAALQRRFPQQQTQPAAHSAPPAYHVRQGSPPPPPSTAGAGTSIPNTVQPGPNQPVSRPSVPQLQQQQQQQQQSGYMPSASYAAAPLPSAAPQGIPVHYAPAANIYTGYGSVPPGAASAVIGGGVPDGTTRTQVATPSGPPTMAMGMQPAHGQMFVAAPMQLQPRSTSVPQAITIVPRTEHGPYAPPAPYAYALPPQLAMAYQHASVVPISNFALQPAMVYSFPVQQQAVFAAMMPASASA